MGHMLKPGMVVQGHLPQRVGGGLLVFKLALLGQLVEAFGGVDVSVVVTPLETLEQYAER